MPHKVHWSGASHRTLKPQFYYTFSVAGVPGPVSNSTYVTGPMVAAGFDFGTKKLRPPTSTWQVLENLLYFAPLQS